MATFNYTVDTSPMASEINSVSNHIEGTTTAVVAMQTAVVIAEAKATDHVCNNVNKGFFTMIRSQISQKIAKLQSDVDSHLMKLNQLKKSLMSIQSRMERDYNMTSNRYLKLFNGLNANLKHRIYEIDLPVVNVVDKDIKLISNRITYLTATVPVTQSEALSTSQQIMASNVKFRALNVINSMEKFLSDMTGQKNMTKSILLRNQEAQNTEILIPVLVSERNHDKHDNKSIDVTINNEILDNSTIKTIKNIILTDVGNFQWKGTDEINTEIKSEFSKLISASSSSSRTKEIANNLFLKNSFQTFNKIAP